MVNRFKAYCQTRRPMLEEALKRVLSDLLDGLTARDIGSLIDLVGSGKKIRGCLTCMFTEAFGGSVESAVPRAISVELIQAATLIHDDFVDQDTIRRGMPATWTIEGARRAVLIGDVIFASAIKLMSDLSKEDGEAVAHAIAEVSKGALREPLDAEELSGELESTRFNDRLYDKIIRLKTGILFGTACRVGAIASAAGSELTKASYAYGVRIGEAYQIADDLDDVKRCLSSESLHPRQMVAIAPAILYFVPGMRPRMIDLLRGESTKLNEAASGPFHIAADLMKKEIRNRLRLAASGIAGWLPHNQSSELFRSAPSDIIRMFNKP